MQSRPAPIVDDLVHAGTTRAVERYRAARTELADLDARFAAARAAGLDDAAFARWQSWRDHAEDVAASAERSLLTAIELSNPSETTAQLGRMGYVWPARGVIVAGTLYAAVPVETDTDGDRPALAVLDLVDVRNLENAR